MKKGQAGVIAFVMIGLVIVGLLAYIVFKLTTSAVTGNVIYVPFNDAKIESSDLSFKNNNYDSIYSSDKYITGSAVINPPFYMNAWSVQSDVGNGNSGIVFELKNNGGESYIIQSIAVTNCGTSRVKELINDGELVSITIYCPHNLIEGNTFSGDIIITYTKLGSSVDLTSTGTLTEKITS